MLEAHSRRAVLGRLAAFPIVGVAGAVVSARPANAEHIASLAQIDAAEQRCHITATAFEKAVVAYEAACPQPHFSLLERERWNITLESERRLFDGAHVNRGRIYQGSPLPRAIANVNSLTYDIEMDRRNNRRRSKALRRLRRRAVQHGERVRLAEEAFDLPALDRAATQARRAMEELVLAIFARSATTLPEIQLQARMLCAFSRVVGESRATYWTARYGAALATNLDKLGAAA